MRVLKKRGISSIIKNEKILLAQLRRYKGDMLFIYQGKTDPYFNLAAEEYILEEKTGDAFLLWRNGPSVIIGKNQNAYGSHSRS